MNDSQIGREIGNYVLESVIGYGGMGVVYLAKHTTLDRKVAIKVLLDNLSINAGIRERFLQEAKLMAVLDHPSIVRLLDFLTDPQLCLIMEYVDGRGLDKMIGQEVGPIPWEKALPLFRQVLSGVGYAHARGVVHRDIKPANILVSAAGEVKITDFGIAKIAGQKGMTRTGAQMGTLYYESPEQIKGARDVDHRADIYALGMTLYEMLAGRLPFDEAGDTSEFQVMNTIVNRQAHLDPREYYPHIPEWLVGVVQKATELEPEVRYQSCEEFLRALEQGGKLGTGEHSYWSGKVASVASVKPITTSASPSTPAPSSPENSCPKCGTPVEKDMEFCGKCGADLQKECPGCTKRIRWHHEHCPKCGVNIEKKKAEIEADADKKSIAEEKRKTEEARIAKENEEERKRHLEEAGVRRKCRILWWKRTGRKVVAGVVILGSVTGYLIYRSSDLYIYHKAIRLYKAGQYGEAVSVFESLGDYRDSRDQSLAISYEIAGRTYLSGDLRESAIAYAKINGYLDSDMRMKEITYELGEQLLLEGDTITAVAEFSKIIGFRDSEERIDTHRIAHHGNITSDYLTNTTWITGSIVAWGDNSYGQCNVPTPNEKFIAISAGAYHSLALREDGTIEAWGNNSSGQCNVPEPNIDFIAISAGHYHSLGLKRDGSVIAWGSNNYGECNVPYNNSRYISIKAGIAFCSFGIREGGSISIWGSNDGGIYSVPTPNRDYIDVTGGHGGVYGLKEDGYVRSWGRWVSTPLSNRDIVSIAGNRPILALTQEGSIIMWDVSENAVCPVPEPNSGYVKISAYNEVFMALRGNGTIEVWSIRYGGGAPVRGELRSVPNPNVGYTDIAAGGEHCLAIRE